MINLDFTSIYSPPTGDDVALIFNPNGAATNPRLRLISSTTLRFDSAKMVRPAAPLVWDVGVLATAPTLFNQGELSAVDLVCSLPWSTASLVDNGFDINWGVAARVSAELLISQSQMQHVFVGRKFVWGAFQQRSAVTRFRWDKAIASKNIINSSWDSLDLSMERLGVLWDRCDWVANKGTVPWDLAVALDFQWPIVDDEIPPVVVNPPFYTPALGGDVPLNFFRPWIKIPGFYVPLNFGSAVNQVPTQEVYIMINSASVTRVSDGANVPCWGVDLDYDQDSFAWSFRCVIPDKITLEMVNPTSNTVDIDININGYIWRVMVEEFDEARKFGSQGYIISGRSRSALLADPYSAPTSHVELAQKTAQQLANDVLALSGFILTWSTADWLVPAGTWSYHNQPRVDALSKIAAASGSVIAPSMVGDEVTIEPRYKYAPWDWSTIIPDHILTPGIVTTISSKQKSNPAYDGVYVSGVQSGILAHVRRTGTAGAQLAEMVMDGLITHQDAAQARGIDILSRSGKQSEVRLTLPVAQSPSSPGLLLPGQIAEVPDGFDTWRAMVTSISISASWQDGLVVTQTPTLERHW